MKLSLASVPAGLLPFGLAILSAPVVAAAATPPQVTLGEVSDLLGDVSAALALPGPCDAVYHALNCQLGVTAPYIYWSWAGF